MICIYTYIYTFYIFVYIYIYIHILCIYFFLMVASNLNKIDYTYVESLMKCYYELA